MSPLNDLSADIAVQKLNMFKRSLNYAWGRSIVHTSYNVRWTLQLVNGWSSSGAVTYVADITVHDVCIGGVVEGCTDPAFCNYDANATTDDGSCADFDLCGVCAGDNSTCGGCTDSTACNYDPAAVVDDGSCLQLDQCGICGGDDSNCSGCTDPAECNYDADAILDDGSCLTEGLDFVLTLNFDNYPTETTWTLTDSTGVTTASGGPYSGAGTTAIESFCAPNGCYTLTVFDSWGDGMCCTYGPGSYTLTVDGVTLALSRPLHPPPHRLRRPLFTTV